MRCFNKCFCIFLLVGWLVGCGKEAPVPVSQQDPPLENSDGDTPATITVTPNSFLSDQQYDQLVVEIGYIEGFQPKAESVNNLKMFLEGLLKKPAGITIVQNKVESPGKSTYSLDDLIELQKANRTQLTKDKTLTAYFFFADGDYAGNSGNSKVLGIAYGGSSMVIFEKTIKEFSGGVTQPAVTTLESTVIHHEFAHILGLVNNGTSMQVHHQDEPHGRHCNDKNCLMYYTAETSDIVGNLVGGNIPKLDARCLSDLKANGGK